MKRFVLIFFFAFWTILNNAQNFTALPPDTLFTGTLYGQQNGFGQAIAIDDSIAVVTYPRQPLAVVYEFDSGKWNKLAVLKPSDLNVFSDFGRSVAIDGPVIVIGAPYANDVDYYMGAAYVFVRPSDGWKDTTESFKLLPFSTAGVSSAYYGTSVAVEDSMIFVGAPGDDTLVYDNGCVYMYKLSISQQDTLLGYNGKLIPSVSQAGLDFGGSMFKQDSLLVVGAPSVNPYPGNPAYVFVFKEGANGWSDAVQIAKLSMSEPQIKEQLGASVWMNGDCIVAGCPYWDGDSSDVGRIAVFYASNGQWHDTTESVVFYPPVQQSGLHFGQSVAFSDRYLFAGMPYFDAGEVTDAGAIAVWSKQPDEPWQNTNNAAVYIDPLGIEQMCYGTSVVLNDTCFIVGAPRLNIVSNPLGGAYFYNFPVIAKQPSGALDQCPDDTALFYVNVIGQADYQWQISTDGGNTFTDLTETQDISGTQTDSLKVYPGAVPDSSMFRCLISGTLKQTVTDTVLFTSDKLNPDVKHDTITVFLNANGYARLYASYFEPYDNCGLSDSVLFKTYVTCDDIPGIADTLILSDNSSNTDTISLYVYVRDTLPPQITLLYDTLTVYTDSLGEAQITADDIFAGSTDNCQTTDSLWLSAASFDCADAPFLTDTLFGLDVNGNVGFSVFTVKIFDTIRPWLKTPDSIAVALDSSGNASITPGMLVDSVWDNCGIADTSVSQLVFSCQNLGANDVIVTVTDVSGLTVQKSIIVYVADTIRPVLQVTEADTVYLDENGKGVWDTAGVVEYAWDNCSADLTVDVPVYNCADLGTDTVTFVLSDQSGNIAIARTVVYVLDTLKPVLTCTGEIIRTADASGGYVVQGDEFDPQVTENCGYVLTNSYNDSLTLSGAVFNPDTTVVVWYVTDVSGNTDSCGSVVIIERLNTGLIEQGSGLIVYPNPAGDKLTVELPVDVEKVKLEVWSVEGKKIMTLPAAANTVSINISDLPAGAYVLRFIADGQVRAVYFVKK